MDKAVLTCALTGVLTDPAVYPALVSPEEMAREARRAFDEGASVVHVHFRCLEPRLGDLPSWDPMAATAVVSAIRDPCPGIIVNQTTGVVGSDITGPLKCLAAVRPEIAALKRGLTELSEDARRRVLGLAAYPVRQSGRQDSQVSWRDARRDDRAGVRVFQHWHRAHGGGHRAQLRLQSPAEI
jgi:uncharacterized protein (DUF849 family)